MGLHGLLTLSKMSYPFLYESVIFSPKGLRLPDIGRPYALDYQNIGVDFSRRDALARLYFVVDLWSKTHGLNLLSAASKARYVCLLASVHCDLVETTSHLRVLSQHTAACMEDLVAPR